MSQIVLFFIFGILNVKYLAFRIIDSSANIGLIKIFIFYFKILFLLSF